MDWQGRFVLQLDWLIKDVLLKQIIISHATACAEHKNLWLLIYIMFFIDNIAKYSANKKSCCA